MGYPGQDNYPKTPELEKLQSIKEKSQVCGEFLDWLMDKYQLAQFVKFEDLDKPRLMALGIPIEKILAEYFNIDLDAVEREKRLLLDYVRSQG